VASCRRHNLDPFAYLRDVFSRLPLLGPHVSRDQLREFLPDRWRPDLIWSKSIGKKPSLSLRWPYVIRFLRHKLLASYWTWARTLPLLASANEALSAFESTISRQSTRGPLLSAQNPPLGVAIRLLRD
jgi:hypothetical protein